jgi:hypothetical protein
MKTDSLADVEPRVQLSGKYTKRLGMASNYQPLDRRRSVTNRLMSMAAKRGRFLALPAVLLCALFTACTSEPSKPAEN